MIDVVKVLEDATKMISPSWPLKSFVASNPFWNLKDKNFYNVMSDLSNIYGQGLFLPMNIYIEKYSHGIIKDQHIKKSIEILKDYEIYLDQNIQSFIRQSSEEQENFFGYKTYSDYISHEENKPTTHQIIDEVSKYCSSYFDRGQASCGLSHAVESLYVEWSQLIKFDSSFSLREKEINMMNIPKNPYQMIEQCSQKLGLFSEQDLKVYVMKICHHMIGWCSHIVFHQWQENLELNHSIRNTTVADIVAIFMHYECSLLQAKKLKFSEWSHFFQYQSSLFSSNHLEFDNIFKILSAWQQALEISYQSDVAEKILQNGFQEARVPVNKDVQMVFCIDVRSEVIRRKIEQACPNIQTHGFAGFFGVSLHCHQEAQEHDTYHCPVLLKPKFNVRRQYSRAYEKNYQGKSSLRRFIGGLKQGVVSSFAHVELFGMMFIFKIISQSSKNLFAKKNALASKFQTPSSFIHSLTDQEKKGAIDFVLTHLGIKQFAKTVFICGHGSHTTNNAFLSSLQCGACGGHSGDLNARFLCDLLNDKDLREEINSENKFYIPSDTSFIPALHETVSDEIVILDGEKYPESQRNKINELKIIFSQAAQRAQEERSKISRRPHVDALSRSVSWAEVRPEWGLARNACLVVAPRCRTESINLEGRAFLHDYDYFQDTELNTLELIMSAPMVVTNWINMQYYASSVCPKTYGAGNKVLHNIVSMCGVLEGNSGDLKIGLPFQSVHDGENLIHEPLRLSVFIEAPVEALEAVISKNKHVNDLIENQWLHIFSINRENRHILRRRLAGDYEIIN